jgi:hypothetical protein
MYTLTEKEIDARFGSIVHQDDYRVVRIKFNNINASITVHDRKDGVEILPKGYLSGANILIHNSMKV